MKLTNKWELVRSLDGVRAISFFIVLGFVIFGGPDRFRSASLVLIFVGILATPIDAVLCRRGRPIQAAVLIVALDTVITLSLLWMQGIGSDSLLSFVLIFPILEASYRLGLIALGFVWISVAFVGVSNLMLMTHDDPKASLRSAQLFGMLMLIALPTGYISSRFVDAAVRYENAELLARERADILGVLIKDFPDFKNQDVSAILRTALTTAATMVRGSAIITDSFENEKALKPYQGKVRVPVVDSWPSRLWSVILPQRLVYQSRNWRGAQILVDHNQLGVAVPFVGVDNKNEILWASGPGSSDPLVREALEILAAELTQTFSQKATGRSSNSPTESK